MSESKRIQYLKPIRETREDFDALEIRLKKHFKKMIYYPLLRELAVPQKTLKNAIKLSALEQAVASGRITFNKGTFSGRFNAEISKELRAMGAKFDRRTGTYKLPFSDVPPDMKNVISLSDYKFKKKMEELDKRLSAIVPEKLASSFKSADLFDRSLFKVNRDFQESVESITVAPKLSESARSRIASEWQENMELWIKDFTEEHIQDLRQKIMDSTLSGDRYGSLVKNIQESYEVSANKAKFLARQETSLLMAKFKEARYQDAGIKQYEWRCVHRPHDTAPNQHKPGNVRYSHGLLEGKIFRWDDPPIISEPGEPVRRGHPGTDFWCRCFARPIIKK